MDLLARTGIELIAHDDVNEAAVIGVPHERWQERPLAMIVPTAVADEQTLGDELREYTLESYPNGAFRTTSSPSTGRRRQPESAKSLRDEYADESLVEGRVRDDAAPE